MNKEKILPPYECFEGDSGGFLIVEFPKTKLALPYIALRQMTHHEDAERIVLEFTEQNIELHGKGLSGLFKLLAILKVKTIRIGSEEKGTCKIEKLSLQNG